MDEVCMEIYKVALLSDSRSPQIAAVRLYDDNEDRRIALTFADVLFEEVAEDYFESFCLIRNQLEAIGLKPNCYAADLRSYPSGMARSMGGGLKLYRLTLGSQARASDLVHMFDTHEGVEPATVRDQRQFFDTWLASLG